MTHMPVSNTKYPSQSSLAAEYGFNKYQLADVMRNNFHIPDPFLQALSQYRVVHMNGTGFSRILVDGTVHGFPDSSTLYGVIYHNCNPFAVKRAQELRVSYRAAIPEFNLEAYALVEVITPGQGE